MAHKEQSVFDDNFLNTVQEWFEASPDIFVVARYSHTAGSRNYLWFKSYDKFKEQLKQFPPQADICVFRDKQLPIRGIVDDAFINQVLATIPDNTEASVYTRRIYGCRFISPLVGER